MGVCKPWHSHPTLAHQYRVPLKGIPGSSALELCTGALSRSGLHCCKASCPCVDDGGVLGCGWQDLWGHSTNEGNQRKRERKQKKTRKYRKKWERSTWRKEWRMEIQGKVNERNHFTHVLKLPENFKITLNTAISGPNLWSCKQHFPYISSSMCKTKFTSTSIAAKCWCVFCCHQKCATWIIIVQQLTGCCMAVLSCSLRISTTPNTHWHQE